MDVGTNLEIQFKGGGTQLTSELTGVEDNKYLMIKWPTIDPTVDASSLICKGNTVFVKYLHEGIEFSFQSRILEVISNPAKLIFIKYPENTEVNVLREHRRIDCYLPASVRITGNTIEGTIIDISREGCQFTAEKSKIESSLKIFQVENETSVSFKLPGVEKVLTVTGKQKYIIEDSDIVKIGILFDNMAIEVQERLFDFLSTAGA